jgi:hypothetical protein
LSSWFGLNTKFTEEDLNPLDDSKNHIPHDPNKDINIWNDEYDHIYKKEENEFDPGEDAEENEQDFIDYANDNMLDDYDIREPQEQL